MKIIITESERIEILKMYNVLVEDKRPLQKLMECQFTSDGKYVVFEGVSYSTQTGEIVFLNESWSLSDILHTGADILSAGMDFVIPGSGAIIDTLNAISYVIEAQFKSEKEKDSLYIMAAITFAFVLLPGPLQAISTPLKRAIKTGVGMTSKVVVRGLKLIGGSLNVLLLGIPKMIQRALKSPLAKNILGKFKDKISGFIGSFTARIKPLLLKISGKEGSEVVGKKIIKNVDGGVLKKLFTIKGCENMRLCDSSKFVRELSKNLPNPNTIFNPSKIKVLQKSNVAGREVAELQLENGSKVLFYKSSGANVATTGKNVGEWVAIPGFAKDGWFIKTTESIAITKGGNKYATSLSMYIQKNGVDSLGKQVAKTGLKNSLSVVVKKRLSNFFTKIPKITKGPFFLRKLGFVVGKPYRYMGPSGKAMTGTIKEITDKGLKVIFKGGKGSVETFVPVETFVAKAIGAPWLRRGSSVLVPLFVKRLSDVILDDGSINYDALSKMEDLDPAVVSQESLNYMAEEVATFEGGSGQYNVNTNVTTFQNALIGLGYPLPKFGADGKFGPETQEGLKKFQTDNNLTSSVGKMDRFTAKKMSELLKTKNVPNTNELQTVLSKI